MLDIKDYLLEYERKIPNILVSWIVILSFIIIIGLIINSTFKIVDYYKVEGIVKNSELILVLPLKKIDYIIDNNYVYIDDKKYNYSVKSLSEDIINNNNEFYQEVILDIDLKDKNFIDNKIVSSKFIINKKTILIYIYNLFKGE